MNIIKYIYNEKLVNGGLKHFVHFLFGISILVGASACSEGKKKKRYKKPTTTNNTAERNELKESDLSKKNRGIVTDREGDENPLKNKPETKDNSGSTSSQARTQEGSVTDNSQGIEVARGFALGGDENLGVKSSYGDSNSHQEYIREQGSKGDVVFVATTTVGPATSETGGYTKAKDPYVDSRADELMNAARQEIDYTDPIIKGASKDFSSRIDQIYVFVDRANGPIYMDLMIHDGIGNTNSKRILNLSFTGKLIDGTHANLYSAVPKSVGEEPIQGLDKLAFFAKLVCLDDDGGCQNVMVKLMQLDTSSKDDKNLNDKIIRIAYFIHRWGDAKARTTELQPGQVYMAKNKNYIKFGQFLINTNDAYCKNNPTSGCRIFNEKFDGDSHPLVAKKQGMRTWAVAYGAARFHLVIEQRGGLEEYAIGPEVTPGEIIVFVGTLKASHSNPSDETWRVEFGDQYHHLPPVEYWRRGAGSSIQVDYDDTYAAGFKDVHISDIDHAGHITLKIYFAGDAPALPIEIKFTNMVDETRNIRGDINALFAF